MHRFAALYARLDDTRSTQAKLDALATYFAGAPARDAAWGLWLLLGNRLKRLIAAPRLRAWAAEASGLAPAVVDESYAHVGDLAETIALLLDRAGRPPADPALAARGLADWIEWLLALKGLDEAAQRAALLEAWRALPPAACFLLNKLLTGALRVGVSGGLAAKALARHAQLPEPLIAQRIAGDWQPSAEAFARLLAAGDGARDPAQPYPFCLAAPLEDAPDGIWRDGLPSGLGDPHAFVAEWKWDGIRGQLIRRGGRCFLWSRGEEPLGGRFPEIEAAAAALPEGCVLDGEILAHDGARVLPFASLQRRISRKSVGRKLLAEAPVAFVAYDLLEAGGEDWRARPLAARRERLEALIAGHGGARLRLSERIEAGSWDALQALRAGARERGVEGLMLKRLDAPYVAGRRRGIWWKWKIAALTIDCVLVYAQAGHGRRANLYTDYTLAVWAPAGDGAAADGRVLVPVAKAYSGLSDAELAAMDRWIRRHTREKFGPVRSVEPLQVFEIAFEGIQASPRHKAGIALRFPRIARWRMDKAAHEADTLDDLRRLLHAGRAGAAP